MKIILWDTCYFNKIEVIAWNYKSFIAKTFDSNTLKLKVSSPTKVIKNKTTMFLFVFWSDAHSGFARQFLACPIGRRRYNFSGVMS